MRLKIGMKRFMVFCGLRFYPSEGIKDFVHDFDTQEEALEYIRHEKFRKKFCECDSWCQIFDCDTGEFIEYRNDIDVLRRPIKSWDEGEYFKSQKRTSEELTYWSVD